MVEPMQGKKRNKMLCRVTSDQTNNSLWVSWSSAPRQDSVPSPNGVGW